jgi:hypothetical protein
MEGELLRVWQLIHELSDQLAHNQKIANTLQSQAGALKVCIFGAPEAQVLLSLRGLQSYVESSHTCRRRVCAAAVQHGHFERYVAK